MLLGLALHAQSVTYTCRYWFDQNDAQAVTTTFTEGVWQTEWDVGTLPDGLHTLHIQAADTSSAWCPPLSYMFLKMSPAASLIDSVDMSNLTYHCWFDQDFEHQLTGALGNGSFLFDVSDLEEGLHSVNIMLEGSALTASQSYMFVKVAQQEPLIEPIDMSQLVYHCWFDQDYENRVTDSVSNGIILLDVDNVSDGLHSVHILLEGEALTSTLTYLFFKRPVQEDADFGIARWQYVLNGDGSRPHTTELSSLMDTLDIIALLPVETWPVRSSCFHFQPNGDEPYLNAKNEITFLFWSNDDRLSLESAFYVDYQVQQDIAANVFERNTTETFAAPRNNQIQWFKLDAVAGDSLSFVANKACTMQLFAPSGEEVYAATASKSIVLGGCHAWENGTYYLAVHDVTGSGETISVTYNWIYRYAVLAYDVHLVGNGGCSTITCRGNGFNSLLGAYLVNAQNDTIPCLYIGHESNTTTTITFDFYGVNLGVYDAVFKFWGEETIRINGALEVQEPVDIQLTTSMSYCSVFVLGQNLQPYTYTITNNGNMSAYAVPIRVYISTPTKDGISHLEFDGLDLPSIIDGMDMDSLSESDRIQLREWADEMGDDHYFLKIWSVDEQTGDSVFVRSNYFFLTFAPFETKTLTLRIKSDYNGIYETFISTHGLYPIGVWMSVTDEIQPPLVLSPDGNRGDFLNNYCCAKDQIQCTINLVCSTTAILGLIPQIAAAMSVARCVCGFVGALNEEVTHALCGGNSDENSVKSLINMKKALSIVGTVISCINRYVPAGQAKDIVKDTGLLLKEWTVANVAHDSEECGKKWAQLNLDDCSPNPDGGPTNAINPRDPNDIHGYLSESGSHYMRQEIQNIHYEIEFENDTTLATAAAHTIIVRDTLDATKFDLNSLATYSVTIGDKRLELNGEQNFARTLDMRPELYVIAQINQDYDPETGIIEWTIQSLDPMTMEPTDNPYQGVLPVNYYGDGVGVIDYSINLKQAFDDGTEVSNRAGIIFDLNEVIITPTWTNIVDAVKPTSHIENVTIEADSLNFSFVSSDSRSGVWYHNLYYRNVSTEQEWQVRKAQIFEDSFMLPIDSLRTTEYLVMAVDSAGNVEDKEMVAEYVMEANPSGIHFIVSGDWSEASNWANGVMPGADDEAYIDAHCTLDIDAEVASLIVSDRQSLTIPNGQTLTVTDSLTNTGMTGLVIEDGGQLVHTNTGTQGTVQKDIMPYTNNHNNWYLIAPPVAGQTEVSSVANLLRNDYDLYYYDEPTQYWINQEYADNNFTELNNGKGYLYANDWDVTLGFAGELLNGSETVNVPLSYTGDISFEGFNLVGNPFAHNITSYGSVNVANGCYQMNEERSDLVVNEISEANPLHPAEGFFVKATGEGASITFNPGRGAMANSNGSIRVELSENGKLIDRLIVKTVERQSLEKLSLNERRTKLFAQGADQEWAIVSCEGNEQPVNFKAARNGQYTIAVNADGMEFCYLHLIDHLTGADVDLLVEPSYTFEANTSDYASRFLLQFVPKAASSTGSNTFAFVSNGNIIIVGAEAGTTLQIVDVMGRVLVSTDNVRSFSINGMAKGVYVLHLINGKDVKTQKIVID